jgi:UDP-sulfoquinovose synthase
VAARGAPAPAPPTAFDPFLGFNGRKTYVVLGQFTEQFNILQLAEFVTAAATHLGLEAHIAHLPNPRVEPEAHYYNAVHTRLTDLGLEPHLLSDTLVESLMRTAIQYRDSIDVSQLPPRVDWRRASNQLGRTD